MSPLALVVAAAVALSALMAVAHLISDRTGKSGWTDTTWTFAVGAVGAAGALAPLTTEAPLARRIAVALLVAVWSVRLGAHILARTLHGGDDPRYAQMKQAWGARARSKMFWFLQVQAAVALPLVVSVFIAAHNPEPWPRPFDVAGILVLVAAIVGEAVADRQLRRFAADPANRGRVCDVGLWGVSRHPNYFFEWIGWVAYALIAIDLPPAYPWGWAALIGPATMYWLLVHVSGIPPLEEHMMRSRPEAFRAYQSRVSAFWPAPPRRGA